MQLAYGLYMAEQAGLLDTRQSKLQNIIKMVKNHYRSTIPVEDFIKIVEACGIQYDTLTDRELKMIQNAIRARP